MSEHILFVNPLVGILDLDSESSDVPIAWVADDHQELALCGLSALRLGVVILRNDPSSDS